MDHRMRRAVVRELQRNDRCVAACEAMRASLDRADVWPACADICLGRWNEPPAAASTPAADSPAERAPAEREPGDRAA